MREHKYRAWYKGVSGEGMLGEIIEINFEEKFIQANMGVYGYPRIDFKDIILIQYTGLKDKRNREIYEGDILQRWNNVQKRWEDIIIIHSIEDLYFDESHGFNLFGGNEEYQIRGNIYENPELLERNNK